MKKYRIRIAGRIFENTDPRVLMKRAVAAKKSHTPGRLCKNCGGPLGEPELARFGFCICCIERAVAVFQSQRKIAV